MASATTSGQSVQSETKFAAPSPRQYSPGQMRRGIAVSCLGLVLATVAACAPVYRGSEQVASEPPEVTYDYSTDDGLLEASAKARNYCGQYAATPAIQGSILQNADGSNRVNFVCVKTGAVPVDRVVEVYPPPPAPPSAYVYRTDSQLLAAIESADAYCSRSGHMASTRIVTNLDGTKNLNFQCVPN